MRVLHNVRKGILRCKRPWNGRQKAPLQYVASDSVARYHGLAELHIFKIKNFKSKIQNPLVPLHFVRFWPKVPLHFVQFWPKVPLRFGLTKI